MACLKSFDALCEWHTALITRVGKSVLIMKEASWEGWGGGRKTLKFVKDVRMICVNLVINAIVAPEKRKGVTFVQCSCTIEMLSL
jgi:hypothetical protein